MKNNLSTGFIKKMTRSPKTFLIVSMEPSNRNCLRRGNRLSFLKLIKIRLRWNQKRLLRKSIFRV